jgi:hypothetical protein
MKYKLKESLLNHKTLLSGIKQLFVSRLPSLWNGYQSSVLRALYLLSENSREKNENLEVGKDLKLALEIAELSKTIDSQMEGLLFFAQLSSFQNEKEESLCNTWVSLLENTFNNENCLDIQRKSIVKAIEISNLLRSDISDSLKWRIWKIIIEALQDQQSFVRTAACECIQLILNVTESVISFRALELVFVHLSELYYNNLEIISDTLKMLNEISFEHLEYFKDQNFLNMDESQYDEDLFEKEKANEFKETLFMYELCLGFLCRVLAKNPNAKELVNAETFILAFKQTVDFIIRFESSWNSEQQKWILHYEKGDISNIHQIFQSLYTNLMNISFLLRFGILSKEILDENESFLQIRSMKLHPLISRLLSTIEKEKDFKFDSFLSTPLFAEQCNA